MLERVILVGVPTAAVVALAFVIAHAIGADPIGTFTEAVHMARGS